MGCDYYIEVYLEIEHIHGTSYTHFQSLRGYFCELECGVYDSDDEEDERYYHSVEYNILYQDMVRFALTPRKPMVIYASNSFTKPEFETKYLKAIQAKMDPGRKQKYCHYTDTGKFTSLDQVINVTKKERRYEPGHLEKGLPVQGW